MVWLSAERILRQGHYCAFFPVAQLKTDLPGSFIVTLEIVSFSIIGALCGYEIYLNHIPGILSVCFRFSDHFFERAVVTATLN